MLSNPPPPSPSPSPSTLQARQRLHRRQRSTPVAVEAAEMPGRLSAKNTNVAVAMQQQQQHQQHQQPRSPPAQPQQQRVQRQQSTRQLGHRRGLSLDTRRQQLQQRQQRQIQIQHQLMAAATPDNTGGSQQEFGNSTVSNTTTNTGSSTTQQQHVMRETQQQRTVRPGSARPAFAKQPDEEAFLLSSQGPPPVMISPNTPQFGNTGAARRQQNCLDFANGPAAALMMKRSLSTDGMPFGQGFDLFGSPNPDGNFPSNAFMTFQDPVSTASPMGVAAATSSSQGWVSEDDTSSTRRTTRRISNGILDRVAKFETLLDGMARPATPPRQNENNTYFPPTPTETPQERMAPQVNNSTRLARFSDDYDESMEETIKPSRNHGSRSNRASGIFDEMRQQAEALATPPRPHMMHMPLTPADFMNMSNVNAEFLKIQNGSFAGLPVATADMQHLSPPLSQQATPASVQNVFDGSNLSSGLIDQGAFDTKPDLWPVNVNVNLMAQPFVDTHVDCSSPGHAEPLTSMRRRSPHRRNESLASIASAASIASINIDETRTETGVTLDDIATYIEGPSPVDGKWRCLYESCDKRFGRKENIKSHVQTHLNDRQYQCPHCQKCFVRQHDLKRHAKIHTGVKPYPCECGNHFARHDALTRHRQRGMCIGAFDGAVRKIGKRGRPRKTRPSIDERRDKSTRTRSKNKTSSGSSPEASSHSGYSDSSAVNSPRTSESDNAFDDDVFDVHDSVRDDDILDMGFSSSSRGMATGLVTGMSGTMNPSALAVSSAPMPGAGMSSMPNMSRISTQEMIKMMPVVSPAALAASPSAMSAASHYTTQHPSTPPELSASSSPPHSSARYFDLDPNSSCTDEESVGMSAPLTAGGCGGLGMDVGGLASDSLDDDVMLKAFTTDEMMVQLDDSGLSMLNTSKYDDDYSMFSNSDDVFFGSS